MAKREPIRIGSTEIAAGERAKVRLPVADLYTGTSLSMPVEVVHARRPGPTLFVCAAIHGDELNGVEVIRRLLKLRLLGTIRGTLIVVPVVNVHGFLDQSRYLPDRRDLNRCFPGSPRGSIAGRLAHTFLNEIVAKADYGIDLHTGAVNRSNLPQIRGNLDDEETLKLAQVFGVPVIVNANIRDGSLRASAAEAQIPILIYEAGEALRFDEVSIRAGVGGIVNVMRAVGMLREVRRGKRVRPVLARSTSWVRAPASGIVGHKVALGSTVIEGEIMATIGNPLGDDEQDVLAPFDGIVIGRSNLPLAHEGDALFNVAAFRSVTKAGGLVERFVTRHEDDYQEMP